MICTCTHSVPYYRNKRDNDDLQQTRRLDFDEHICVSYTSMPLSSITSSPSGKEWSDQCKLLCIYKITVKQFQMTSIGSFHTQFTSQSLITITLWSLLSYFCQWEAKRTIVCCFNLLLACYSALQLFILTVTIVFEHSYNILAVCYSILIPIILSKFLASYLNISFMFFLPEQLRVWVVTRLSSSYWKEGVAYEAGICQKLQ